MENTTKNFKLSKRLETIKNMVPAGSVPVDIGTDHGYVPIALVQEGKVSKAVAADILEGPLAAAREHIEAAGLTGQIDVVLSDGFAKLAEGCADTAIICGMGGMTVLSILEGRQTVGAGLKTLVLSPQSDVERVRIYLRDEGFDIEAEAMVYEDGKYYPVIRAVKTSDVHTGTGTLCTPVENVHSVPVPLCTQRDVCDMFGPCLIADRDPVLAQYLRHRKDVAATIRKNLEKSEKPERTQAKLAELDAELKLIEIAEELMQ